MHSLHFCSFPNCTQKLWAKKFENPHFCNNHYDALSLYVTGLNMVLEEGGDPKDGKSLVAKLLSRSYHSAMGYR